MRRLGESVSETRAAVDASPRTAIHNVHADPRSPDSTPSAHVLYIPTSLTEKDQTTSIVLTEYLAYHSKPLPEVIKQDEAQYLQFSEETSLPETVYKTKKMTVKYRYVGPSQGLTKGPLSINRY